MKKLIFIITGFLFFLLSHELIGQDKESHVSIIQLSEDDMYNLKDSLLLSLNTEYLKKGNWTKEDLLKFSRNFKYKDYLENLTYLKENIDALKCYESKLEAKESNSELIIKTTFETNISKTGYITQIVKFNLVRNGIEILQHSNWNKIKKELKSR